MFFAQQDSKQGEVTYLETVKMDIKIEGMSEEMMKMIPKEQKSTKVLYFNENESSYQNSKAESDDMNELSEQSGFKITMSQPDNKVYINYKDKMRIEQKEFMTRNFLISEKLTQSNWKITGNEKMILDYPCQEASQTTEKDTIVVWFAPSIPVSSGPANYINLPGLVLEVNLNNGKRIISAQNIEFKEIDKSLINKPKKGKKVSQAEYNKIIEEKMKEMGGDFRGGGTIIEIRK